MPLASQLEKCSGPVRRPTGTNRRIAEVKDKQGRMAMHRAALHRAGSAVSLTMGQQR